MTRSASLKRSKQMSRKRRNAKILLFGMLPYRRPLKFEISGNTKTTEKRPVSRTASGDTSETPTKTLSEKRNATLHNAGLVENLDILQETAGVKSRDTDLASQKIELTAQTANQCINVFGNTKVLQIL